jgi:PKD repeat protein
LDPQNTGMVTAVANAEWEAEFKVPHALLSPDPGTDQTIFVSWDTEQNPTGLFNYGFVDNSPTGGGLYTSQCGLTGACAATGTVNPDGTITIKLDLTTPITFTDTTNVLRFSMSALPAGTQLTTIVANTFLCACAAGNGLLFNEDLFTADGPYTILTNVSCSNPPVGALSASPTSGNAPLPVNFNASGSNIPAGGCGTINSYIFDFGDATQMTQSTPTISHTYNNAGTYAARVRVTSTVGLTSSNIAEQVITVNSSGPPQLSSVVSRDPHRCG